MNLKKTPEKMRIFLTEYVATCRISLACKAAGISRETAYAWLRTDEQFAKDFAEANAQSLDTIRDEMARRALEGYYEIELNSEGRIKATHKVSNQLLVHLDQTARASKYGKKEPAGEGDAINAQPPSSLAGMSQDAIAAKLKSILEAAEKRAEARKGADKRLQALCDELI